MNSSILRTRGRRERAKRFPRPYIISKKLTAAEREEMFELAMRPSDITEIDRTPMVYWANAPRGAA